MRNSLFFTAWLIFPLLCLAAEAPVPEKPNIIILMADDLGFADLGVQGCKDIPTPNIDSIAKNGILFTNAYVSSPTCTPSRSGLMSGQYPSRHADEELLGKPTNKDGLSLAVTTLPQRLKTAGYVTGLIGKWHLGDDKAHFPLARGFDEFYGCLGGRSYHPMDAKAVAEHMTKPTKGDPRIYRDWNVVPDPPYTTDAYAEEAVQFIERHKDQPFFLNWCSQAPHAPTQPCERLIGKFSGIQDKTRREYASMVAAMDEAVGRILDTLKKNGLEKKTIIFFYSDNGGPISLTGNGSSNAPLKSEKFTTWEGGVHVPFLVQWPGVLPEGVVYKKPIIQLDITATALDLAGLKPQPDWHLDGVNLMPYLLGENHGAPHDVLYFRAGKRWAILDGDMKLVECTETPKDAGSPTKMLIDLGDDIGEKSDLKDQQPEKAGEMESLFRKWSAEVNEQAKAAKAIEKKLAPESVESDHSEKLRSGPAASGADQKLSKSEERKAAREAAKAAKKNSAAPAPAGKASDTGGGEE